MSSDSPYATHGSSVFTDRGPIPFLLLYACVNCALQLVAAFFNLNLCWIAFRHKKLGRSSANWLIGLNALCESVFQLHLLQAAWNVLSGRNTCPFWQCLLAQSVPFLALNLCQPLVLLTAVDRLCCVLLPVWHHRLCMRHYLGLLLLVGLPYALWMLWYPLAEALDSPNEESLCFLADMFHSALPFAALLLCNGLAILCYAAIWLLLRFRLGLLPAAAPSSSAAPVGSDDFNARIARSLALLVLSLTVGWTFTAVCRWLVPALGLNEGQRMQLSWVYTLALDLAGLSNLFVLFVSSVEYRQAIRAHFWWFFCLFGRNRLGMIGTMASNAANIQQQMGASGTPSKRAGTEPQRQMVKLG